MYVEETRRQVQKVKEIGYKLYYAGEDGLKKEVGIPLIPEIKKGVLEVNQESDRVMWV